MFDCVLNMLSDSDYASISKCGRVLDIPFPTYKKVQFFEN